MSNPATAPTPPIETFALPPGERVKYRGVWLYLPLGAQVQSSKEDFEKLVKPRGRQRTTEQVLSALPHLRARMDATTPTKEKP